MTSKTKIGVIICDRYRQCAGGKCFRAMKNREGAFSIYKDQEVELVGYTTCDGCPGGNIEYTGDEMVKNGAQVIHLADIPGSQPKPRKQVPVVRNLLNRKTGHTCKQPVLACALLICRNKFIFNQAVETAQLCAFRFQAPVALLALLICQAGLYRNTHEYLPGGFMAEKQSGTRVIVSQALHANQIQSLHNDPRLCPGCRPSPARQPPSRNLS